MGQVRWDWGGRAPECVGFAVLGGCGRVGQAEAIAQPAVEIGRPQPHQAQPAGRSVDADPVARVEDAAQLPVDADRGLSRVRQHPQPDRLVRRRNDGAVEGHMRCDRGEHDRLGVRRQDRPTGREAVRRRAGRRRHDHSVSRVRRQQPPGQVHTKRHLVVPSQLLQYDVVQRRNVQRNTPAVALGALRADSRRRQRRPMPVAQQRLDPGRNLQRTGRPHGQRHPLLEAGPAVVHRLERSLDVAARHLGQEADLAEVHPEYGGVVLGRDPGTAQERPVTAQCHDQIRVAGVMQLVHAAAPVLVRLPDVDVGAPDPVPVRPLPHGPGRLHGQRTPLVNNQPKPAYRHDSPPPDDYCLKGSRPPEGPTLTCGRSVTCSDHGISTSTDCPRQLRRCRPHPAATAPVILPARR